jgi:hypothetical protein
MLHFHSVEFHLSSIMFVLSRPVLNIIPDVWMDLYESDQAARDSLLRHAFTTSMYDQPFRTGRVGTYCDQIVLPQVSPGTKPM